MSSFFVAGTDTNVGKTTAARAMIQALQGQGVQVVGYKPIVVEKRVFILLRSLKIHLIMIIS